ncbi:MAG: proline--tRNA ligase [Dehalococcoidia bacterium]
MKFSNLFGKTQKNISTNAESISHRLMLRAGFILQIAAGVYAYMPIAYKAFRKIENIIRNELNKSGAQEVHMPALQPVDLWEKSNRKESYGSVLFQLKDRRERELVLGPTHEEVITQMVKSNVESYRDLPLNLYQIQVKFRDEARPRAGLLRGREFHMKDAYSFDIDQNGLDKRYDQMVQVYKSIFQKCGLPVLVVQADSGAIGGKDSQEFILTTDVGEDTIIYCDSCEYVANSEKAVFSHKELPLEDMLNLKEVNTPSVKTIEEVSKFFNSDTTKTIKSVIYIIEGELVMVSIRGDLEINEVKLSNIFKGKDLRLANDDELIDSGLLPGFISPVGLQSKTKIHFLYDNSLQKGNNYISGANKIDSHYDNVNISRDITIDEFHDLALADAGYKCTECGNTLNTTKGVEVGHVFKLGTSYSESLGAYYTDENGSQRPILMGCYGIGVGRVLAAAIEQNHDDKGIIFPPEISPYQIHLVGINLNDTIVAESCDRIYNNLNDKDYEVIFDDRDESAGVKLADADLMGFPIRMVISSRSLKNNSVEIKLRKESESFLVELDKLEEYLISIS